MNFLLMSAPCPHITWMWRATPRWILGMPQFCITHITGSCAWESWFFDNALTTKLVRLCIRKARYLHWDEKWTSLLCSPGEILSLFSQAILCEYTRKQLMLNKGCHYLCRSTHEEIHIWLPSTWTLLSSFPPKSASSHVRQCEQLFVCRLRTHLLPNRICSPRRKRGVDVFTSPRQSLKRLIQ